MYHVFKLNFTLCHFKYAKLIQYIYVLLKETWKKTFSLILKNLLKFLRVVEINILTEDINKYNLFFYHIYLILVLYILLLELLLLSILTLLLSFFILKTEIVSLNVIIFISI